jgi:AcrR family transcriptional regulator
MGRLATETKIALAREPKQDRSRASFERVLDAATELLAEKGYSEFTLQELSRRSKVSIGSIYCRVNGKDDLIRLVQVRVLDRLDVDQATFINRLRRQELPLRELVLETVTQFGNFLRKHASILRAFMELGANDPVAGEIGKKHFNRDQARGPRPRSGGVLPRGLRIARSLSRARNDGSRAGRGQLGPVARRPQPHDPVLPPGRSAASAPEDRAGPFAHWLIPNLLTI